MVAVQQAESSPSSLDPEDRSFWKEVSMLEQREEVMRPVKYPVGEYENNSQRIDRQKIC